MAWPETLPILGRLKGEEKAYELRTKRIEAEGKLIAAKVTAEGAIAAATQRARGDIGAQKIASAGGLDIAAEKSRGGLLREKEITTGKTKVAEIGAEVWGKRVDALKSKALLEYDLGKRQIVSEQDRLAMDRRIASNAAFLAGYEYEHDLPEEIGDEVWATSDQASEAFQAEAPGRISAIIKKQREEAEGLLTTPEKKERTPLLKRTPTMEERAFNLGRGLLGEEESTEASYTTPEGKSYEDLLKDKEAVEAEKERLRRYLKAQGVTLR